MSSKRCIIYGRLSQDRDGEGVAKVDRQIEACRRRADFEEWPLVCDPIRDDGVSAYSDKPRPGFEQLIEHLQNREVDIVLVWKPDRLYRRLKDYVRLYELSSRHPFVIRTADGDVAADFATASGRFIAGVFANMAMLEVEINAERKEAMFRAQAEQGKIHRRTKTLGYGSDGLTIDRNEAAALREAATMVLAGDSMTRAAEHVTEVLRPYQPDPDSFRVSPRVLREVLLAHRIIGRRAYSSKRYMRQRPPDVPKSRYPPEFIVDADWPAILDEPTWDALHLLLNDPTLPARSPRSTIRSAMLSGLMFCAQCGHGLNLTARNYSCPSKALGGCGGVAISRSLVENFFRDSLGLMIQNGAAELRPTPAAESRMSEDDIAKARTALREERDAILDRVKTDDLPSREAFAEITKLEEKIKRVGQPPASEYEARRGERRLVSALSSWASDEGPADDDVRAVLQATVRHIVITKARTRGPAIRYDRIHVHWNAKPCDCTVTDRPRTVTMQSD